MKTCISFIMAVLLSCLMVIEPCNAQKRKVSFKKGKSFLNKMKKTSEPEQKLPSAPEPANDRANNEAGPKGRKLTPPDVGEQITNAKAAYSDHSLTESRFYIEQAIVGIELQIGYKILNSMPDVMLGMDADKTQDEVYSSGAGFVGLSISRQYHGDEGYNSAMVANSSLLSSGAQMAVSSSAMSGYDDNSKVTRYKGYKTMLQVDDYSGYKMSVPFGQSSVFILECRTCASEDQLMQVADLFDIDEFKALLGEK